MSRDYSQQDYDERCADIDTALKATQERIEEWDEHADPHGWWHERPDLIALVKGWAMADDLAAALDTAIPFLAPSVRARHPEIEAAAARYRETRQR